MTLFDQPSPPEVDPQEEGYLKKDRWLAVAVCAFVAFVYSDVRLGSISKLRAGLAGVLVYTLGLLILPAIPAFIASRSTERWHRTFVVSFVVVLVVITLWGKP